MITTDINKAKEILLKNELIAIPTETVYGLAGNAYNETALKKIILNGITTISTDFEMMGKKAAELILEQSTEHIEIPFYLTMRSSL